MSKVVWVKNGSSWAPVKYAWVNNLGSYTPVKAMWAAQGNNWVQTYPGTGTILYTQSTTVTIPSGVSYIDVMCIGAGGGGSVGGGAGGQVQINLDVPVTPNSTYSLNVGSPGLYTGLGPGSAGGTTTIVGPNITASAYGGGGGAGYTGPAAPSSGNTGGGSGYYPPQQASSGYTGGFGLEGIVYDNFQAHAGGGGAGAGSGATGWYPVTLPAWGSFMNSYAIWTGGIYDITTNVFNTTIYVPISGYYLFEMSVDNSGYLQLDGDSVLYLEYGDASWEYQASPATANTVYVTAGTHQITMVVTNTGGPAGGAVRISDSSGVNLWTTRSNIDIDAQNNYLPGNGGTGISVVFDSVQYDVCGGGAGSASGYTPPGGTSQIYTGTASFGGGASSQNATAWGGGGGGAGGNGYQGLIAIKYHQ
jgi:hypothetical protein